MVIEKIIVGGESDTQVCTTPAAQTIHVHSWSVRGSDPSTASVAQVGAVTNTTTNPPAVSTTWGTAHSLALFVLHTPSGGSITALPAELTWTRTKTLVSGLMGYGTTRALMGSIDFSPATWSVSSGASRTVVLVPPMPRTRLASIARGVPARFDTTHAPVGLWNFDGTLNDSSGNGLNLTGSSVVYRQLMPNYRGVVSATTLGRAVYDALLAIPGDVTIEAILRMRLVPSNAHIVYFGAATTTVEADNTQYQIDLETEAILQWFSQSGANVGAVFNATSTVESLPSIGELFMVQTTRIANVVQAYLNGLAFGSPSSALATPTGGTNGKLTLMTGTNPPEYYGLKIIASGLTAAQCKAEFNRTLGVWAGQLS